MGLVIQHSPPCLAGFVDCHWYWERDRSADAGEWVLPTGTTELVVAIGGDRPPVVCGPRSRPCFMPAHPPVKVLGVHFRAGGAFPFLNVPANELHNVHVPLDACWGGRAGELQEQLVAARSPIEMFDVGSTTFRISPG